MQLNINIGMDETTLEEIIGDTCEEKMKSLEKRMDYHAHEATDCLDAAIKAINESNLNKARSLIDEASFKLNLINMNVSAICQINFLHDDIVSKIENLSTETVVETDV